MANKETFFPMTTGVPQGSNLDSLPWILIYDGALQLSNFPLEIKMIAHSDYLAVT